MKTPRFYLRGVPVLGRHKDPISTAGLRLLLHRDAAGWNRYRREAADWVVIEHVGLTGRYNGFDFDRCHFLNVHFVGGDFRGCDFTGSRLFHCLCQNADFRGTAWRDTRVFAGSFEGADFRDANLEESVWENQVELTLADFAGAVLNSTTFLANDSLHRARNLTRASVLYDNRVDFTTLEWCERLPAEFLESCGLPVWLRRYYQTGKRPRRLARVFLSYAVHDSDDLHDILFALRDRFLTPLHDRRDAPGGADLEEFLQKQIASSDALLVLLTPRSIRSAWVEREVRWALEQRRPVIPVSRGLQLGRCRRDWVRWLTRHYHVVDWRKNTSPTDVALICMEVERAVHSTATARAVPRGMP